jgi:hypothetical protein
MMAMFASSPPQGIIFGDIHRLDGCVDDLVIGRPSLHVSRVDTKVERHAIYYLQPRVLVAWFRGESMASV